MSIVDYSDKSFVVVGAPSEIWESLADIGGLFNTKLKNLGNGQTRGWVFSKKKTSAVTALLRYPLIRSSTTVSKTDSPAVATATTTASKKTPSPSDDFPVPDKSIRKYVSLLGYGESLNEFKESFGADSGEEHTTQTVLFMLDRFNKHMIENAKTFKEWGEETTLAKKPAFVASQPAVQANSAAVTPVSSMPNNNSTAVETDDDETDDDDEE